MNYLVTGGTGFLGSYICKQLLNDGHNVVCYDYAPNRNSIQQVLTEKELEKVKLVSGDIRDDLLLIHVLQDEKIDKIIHVAGLLQLDSDKNMPATVDINIRGTVNVFEAARICGIKRVVWASSNSAIGYVDYLKQDQLPDDVLHAPFTMYGKCKDTNEFIAKFYNEHYGMETVALRYMALYGVARMRGGANWVTKLINEPALGKSTEVPMGDDKPNFSYIKDAARATVLASTATNLTQNAYSINGDVMTMAEAKKIVERLIPEDIELKLLPGAMGLNWDFDPSPAARDLGFKPAYTFEDGARETINLIRQANGMSQI